MATPLDSKPLPVQPKDSLQNNITAATTTNPRGIPSFPFLPNVTDYVKSISETESVLTRFQEMISKYQFMQSNVERRAAGLREKLPEMKRTLDVVKFLRQRKAKLTGESVATVSDDDKGGDDDLDDLDDLDSNDDDDEDEKLVSQKKTIQTTFPLQDTLYAHAQIDPKTLEEVYLWLGANVMVAYPLDEAEDLLRGKLEKAKESLKFAEEDLEFLRVQVTTLEVATARVHNWDVGEKRKLKEGQQKAKGKSETSTTKGHKDDDDEEN